MQYVKSDSLDSNHTRTAQRIVPPKLHTLFPPTGRAAGHKTPAPQLELEIPRAEATVKPIPQRHANAVQRLEEGSAARVLHEALDFEEAADPPDLEETLADEERQLEDAPPLDTGVGGLGGVAVGALADDDVRLLVLDLGHELGEGAHCLRGEHSHEHTDCDIR